MTLNLPLSPSPSPPLSLPLYLSALSFLLLLLLSLSPSPYLPPAPCHHPVKMLRPSSPQGDHMGQGRCGGTKAQLVTLATLTQGNKPAQDPGAQLSSLQPELQTR